MDKQKNINQIYKKFLYTSIATCNTDNDTNGATETRTFKSINSFVDTENNNSDPNDKTAIATITSKQTK